MHKDACNRTKYLGTGSTYAAARPKNMYSKLGWGFLLRQGVRCPERPKIQSHTCLVSIGATYIGSAKVLPRTLGDFVAGVNIPMLLYFRYVSREISGNHTAPAHHQLRPRFMVTRRFSMIISCPVTQERCKSSNRRKTHILSLHTIYDYSTQRMDRIPTQSPTFLTFIYFFTQSK